MLNPERHAVYREAYELWGLDLQILLLAEEASELVHAAIGYIRIKPESRERLTEEIADVKIMIEQVSLLLGLDAQVENIVNEKIERLQQRIKQAKAGEKK